MENVLWLENLSIANLSVSKHQCFGVVPLLFLVCSLCCKLNCSITQNSLLFLPSVFEPLLPHMGSWRESLCFTLDECLGHVK